MSIHFSTTREEVIAAPVPKQTETYTPVPNALILRSIEERAEANGLIIHDTKYLMNRTGKQAFISWSFETPELPSMRRQIGVVNSYDKSRSLGCATGAEVAKCDNLDFSDFRRLRRHTTGIMEDFDDILDATFQNLDKGFQKVVGDYKYLHGIPLGKDAIPELVGKAFMDDEIITSTQLNVLKRSIQGGDLWGTDTYLDLLMHFTEAMKSSHPGEIIQNHMSAREWVRSQADILLAA